MGQSQPLFVFIITISIIQIEENVDGVLGIRTQGHRMVGTAKTTVLDSETSGSQSIEPRLPKNKNVLHRGSLKQGECSRNAKFCSLDLLLQQG